MGDILAGGAETHSKTPKEQHRSQGNSSVHILMTEDHEIIPGIHLLTPKDPEIIPSKILTYNRDS